MSGKKYSIIIPLLFTALLIFGIAPFSHAQSDKKKKQSLLRDTLDGKLDISNYIINIKGFVPLPYIITQPALGGFGGALAPLLITPKKRPAGYKGYIPPDITAGFGMYTANNSWAAGGGRIGSFPSKGIKYRIFAAYADVNLSYYHQFDMIGEKELKFNIEAAPVFLSISKKINRQNVYLGVQYLYSKNVLKPVFKEPVPDFISSKELDSKIGTMGTFLDFDNRNTIFTPNKGVNAHLLYTFNDNWTGSDYKFQELSGFVNGFIPIKPKWVCGLHVDVQQAFGDVPFYILPDIDMEGIPTARYQGQTTLVVETEQRFDLTYRWSVVAFGGYGKTIQKNQSFGAGTNVYNYGTGFRYFLARAFGLRAGIDIAKGPGTWGYYIVFGQSWNK